MTFPIKTLLIALIDVTLNICFYLVLKVKSFIIKSVKIISVISNVT
jgi:hypothetical protein